VNYIHSLQLVGRMVGNGFGKFLNILLVLPNKNEARICNQYLWLELHTELIVEL